MNTQHTAEELRRLIGAGSVTNIETLLNPITDIANIKAICQEFSPEDPVILAIDGQREEITLYLLEKCFPYTTVHKWAAQCDPWCQRSHGENGGRCPGTYTALDRAKQRGQRKVVRLIEELTRGGRQPGDALPPHCVVTNAQEGRVQQIPKVQVDVSSLSPTEAQKARDIMEKLGMNYMDKAGNLLIHVAANTSAAMVHVCANCRFPVNLQNFAGDTALHVATRQGNEDVMRALLMNGADLSTRNKLGQTALDTASSSISQKLLELYKPGLPTAVTKGDAAGLQRLIRLWCNPNAIIKDKQSALEICEIRRQADMHAGSCYRIINTHRYTLELVHAVLSENEEDLKQIITQQTGWNINVRYQDVKGACPVSCSVQQHNIPVLQTLLETGRCATNIRVREHFSNPHTIPLLLLSAEPSCPVPVWEVLRQHVDTRQALEKDANGNNVLLRAISAEHSAGFISRLLEGRGAEALWERNTIGMHARELAINNNRQDIVNVIDKALFDRVGDFFLLNLPVNFYGREHMDIQNEAGEKLCDIVKQEEDVAALNLYHAVEERANALYEAAARGQVEEVKKLNTAAFRDKNGFTALTRAIVFQQPKVVEALIISQPVLKTTPDNNNRYPLHYAYALKEGQQIIDLLMAKNPHHIEHRVDKDGLEAVEYRALCDSPAVREMLRAAITIDAYGQSAVAEK